MTDAELVARLKANDDDAYREVVARYGNALYAYVYNITGDSQLSEDVLGETYLRMVEHIDNYTFTGAPFKAWLYRIAHNQAINTMKRAQRTVGGPALDDVTVPADDPAVTIASRLEAEEVRAALAELTDEQRQVLLLRFVGDQSAGEIARVLEKTDNAVKQMQFRALRSLGRLLERRG
jgi:RNA polymerase sigma-70 factor (ECF subfamily)